jgi:hypothetical protein
MHALSSTIADSYGPWLIALKSCKTPISCTSVYIYKFCAFDQTGLVHVLVDQAIAGFNADFIAFPRHSFFNAKIIGRTKQYERLVWPAIYRFGDDPFQKVR